MSSFGLIPNKISGLDVFQSDDGNVYAINTVNGRHWKLTGNTEGTTQPPPDTPQLTGVNFYWEFRWDNSALSAPKAGDASGNGTWPRDCSVLSIADNPTTPALNVDPVLRMLDVGSKVAAWDPSQLDSWIKWQVTAQATHQDAGYTYIPVQVISMGSQAMGNYGWTVIDFLFLV